MKNGTIHVQDMEVLSLVKQFAVVVRTDILAGAHGAGLAWLVAMPRWSAVVELMPSILPKFFACVEGWDSPSNLRDSIYGGLAHLANQHHICLRGQMPSVGADQRVSHDFVNFRDYPIHLHVE